MLCVRLHRGHRTISQNRTWEFHLSQPQREQTGIQLEVPRPFTPY